MTTQAAAPSTRVVACLGGESVRLETRPCPRPGAGEMLLRMRVSGLCGTDLFKLAHAKARAGAVLGHEIVGEVEQLGTGVERFRLGQRVAVPHHVPCGVCPLCLRGSETLCAVFREDLLEPGGFSERILVRERAVRWAARVVPDGISDETAVFLEPAACVLRGVRKAALPDLPAGTTPPGTAVVLGAGSMGLLHLLVLRALFPEARVVVCDRIAERNSIALKLGAHAAAEPGDALDRRVGEATAGLGADVVFDTVGGAKVLQSALALTREGGAVVLFAHAGESERADFDLNTLFKHERRVLGTYSGTLREQEEVHRLIVSGRLDASPLITHHLPLTRFEEGVRLARDGRALKVLDVPQ